MEVFLRPVADARVSTRDPGVPQGAARHLYVGRRHPGRLYRSLIRFELPLSGRLAVQRAVLSLYQIRLVPPKADAPHAPPLVVGVYGIAAPWKETRVSWSSQPGYDRGPSALAAAPAGPGRLRFDVTGLAAAWLEGVHPNWGMVLRSENEQAEGLSVCLSRHSTKEDLRPLLELAFEPPPVPDRRVVTRDTGILAAADEWAFTPAFDTAGLQTVTAFGVLVAGEAVGLKLELSFDGRVWVPGRGEYSVTPQSPVQMLASTHYARYLRVAFRSLTPGRPAAVRVVFQGT